MCNLDRGQVLLFVCRLLLKCQSTTVVSGREDTKFTHSPIIKLSNLLTRNVATGTRIDLAGTVLCSWVARVMESCACRGFSRRHGRPPPPAGTAFMYADRPGWNSFVCSVEGDLRGFCRLHCGTLPGAPFLPPNTDLSLAEGGGQIVWRGRCCVPFR